MSRARNIAIHAAVGAAALTSLLSAPSAEAWELSYNAEGMPLRWHEESLRIGVELGPYPDQTEAVIHALDQWNGALEGRLVLIMVPTHQADLVVSWTPDWPYAYEYLALTTLEHRLSGRLVNAKIELNPRIVEVEDRQYDLHTILAHELGHALGLAHEHQIHDATMAPSIPPNTTARRALHDDDIDGVRYLYTLPLDEPMHCSSSAATPATWALFGLSMLVTARRRRREQGR